MKILIYFSGDLDEPKGTPIRVKNIIEQLLKNGVDLYYAGYKCPKNLKEDNFLLIGGRFKRVLSIIKFLFDKNIDIFYIQTSAGLYMAPFIKFFSKSKICLDYHSLMVEEEKVYKNLNFISYNLRKYTDYLLSFFLDFATGVSGRLKEYYKKPVKIFHILPGGVDLNFFNNNITPDNEVLKWKGDSVLIGYAGNTKWYQGLDTVLVAVSKLNKEGKGDFKVLIIASSLEDSILRFIEENNIKNRVFLLAKQPYDKMPSLLIASDILTIVRPSDMVTEYAFPSKFPEYTALGRAMVISRVGDIQNYIKDGYSGILVPPNNVDYLADRLVELTDSNLRNKLGQNAFLLAKEKLDIDKLGSDLFRFLYDNKSRK